MRFHPFWYGLVLALIIPAANAQSTPAYSTVQPYAVSSPTITPTGQVQATVTYRAQPSFAANSPRYVDRAITYSKNSTGLLAKGRIFSPANLGLNAAILALGWALDSITGDIYSSPATPQSSVLNTSQIYRANVNGKYYYSNDKFQAIDAAIYAWGRTPGSIRSPGTGQAACKYTADGLTMCSYAYGVPGTNPPNWDSVHINGNPAGTPATVATPSAIHDAIFPPAKWTDAGYLNEKLPALLRDPATNAVKNTQEVQDAATAIKNELNAAADPAYTPETSPTVSNPATTTAPAVAAEIPAFCAWATTLCEWMDWTKEMPTQPPLEETEFQLADIVNEEDVNLEAYNSGLGSGSCPSSTSLELLGRSYAFSWQPACTIASSASYLLIAFAYLFSIYILLGIRR